MGKIKYRCAIGNTGNKLYEMKMKNQYFKEVIKEFEKQIRFYDEEIERFNDDKLRENRAYYQGCLDMVVEFSRMLVEIRNKYEKE